MKNYNKYREIIVKYKNAIVHFLYNHLDLFWRKRYKLLIGVTTFLIIIIIVIIEKITNRKVDLDASQKIYDLILVITGAFIFWYSRETADLKKISNKSIKELRKQIFLEQRPFIRLQWLNDNGIRIINEGFGIAVNVKLEISNKPTICRSIIAGEKATKSYTDAGFEDAGLDNDQKFLDVFKPSDGYRINVSYWDVAGNKYSQIFIANDRLNDKFELLEWDLPEDFKRTKFKRVKIN